MKKLTCTILVLLACMLGSSAEERNVPLYLKIFDSSNSLLPDNMVNDVSEDENGMLWISTRGGLARFDGRNFRVYRHDPYDKRSLSNDFVLTTLHDSAGVWINTIEGIDYLRHSDGQFLHARQVETWPPDAGSHVLDLKERLHRMFRSSDGTIFALSRDGHIVRMEGWYEGVPVFRKFETPGNRVYAAVIPWGPEGNLLALSNQGLTLFRSDGQTEMRHTPFQLNYDENLNLGSDYSRRIVIVGGGIGSLTEIYQENGNTGRFRKITDIHLPANIQSMVQISDTVLGVATDGQGIALVKSAQDIDWITTANSNLPTNAVYSIFRDSRDNLWFSTYRGGVAVLSNQLNEFDIRSATDGRLSHNIVTAVVPGLQPNSLILGLDGGGLDFVDLKSGEINTVKAANSDLPTDNVTDVIRDGNTLWLTIYSYGLVHYNLETGAFEVYPLSRDYEPAGKVWTLMDGGDGHIYVGGASLHIFDKNTGRATPVPETRGLEVLSIEKVGDNLYVATRNAGLLQFDRVNWRLVARHSDLPSADGIRLPGHNIEQVHHDDRNRLWISLHDGALVTYDLSSGQLKTFGPERGLGDTRVQSIVADPTSEGGDMWMGTPTGLYHYIAHRDRFIKMHDERLPHSYTHAARNIGSNLYFGTTGGLLSMPCGIQGEHINTAPSAFLTEIEVQSGDHAHVMDVYGSKVDHLTLQSDENFFTLSFAVPEAINAQTMTLECLLEGFETGWHDISDTRHAVYTNVPPGKYKLRLRVDGVVTAQPTMTLQVLNPWYKRWWAIIIWMLLIFGFVGFFTYMVHRNHKQRELAREARRERENAKKLNEAKLDFYASISHELRTPCFLISAQIEELMESKRISVPMESLTGIYRNSLRLNRLISHILDFRKIDTSNLKLNPRPIDIQAFFNDLANEYQALCAQRNIRFTMHMNADGMVNFDPDKIEIILTNLITNAYKYTKRDGSVDLTVDCPPESGRLVIRVSDTGIGIMKSLQEAIFEPYYRTERGSQQSKGDGIGLAFVKEMVELHNGTISLESEVNKGSVFTVEIPVEHSETGSSAQSTEKWALGMPAVRIAEVPTLADPTATHSLLIVDDDAELCSMLAETFHNKYRVTALTDPEEGLEEAKSGHYDLVITDIMMPGLSGHDIIGAIRGDKSLSFVKIVVLSAVGSDDDMKRAYEEGVDLYLIKPLSLKVLRHHIDHMLTQDNSRDLPGKKTYSRDEQKFILKCRSIIDESLLDPDFGIALLANRMAMSHSALYKKIKSMTGLSVVDFINEYRIFKAVSLFRQGMTNVTTVADMCGFRDSKTFRETFKRKMNMPPKEYIQSIHSAGGALRGEGNGEGEPAAQK